MKRIIGLIILAIAVTLITPQASSAELRYNTEDTRRIRRPVPPPTIDYALRTIESLKKGGAFSNNGIYTALVKQFSSAKALVSKDKIRPARNILNATGRLLDAQSGKLISDRGAALLKSIISRIRL